MSGIGTVADPITFSEFTELMWPLEPFETAPNIAVACSGGPDSMALLVLAQGWVKLAGGKLTALIVDHRLRDESTAEAVNVARRARELGVEAVILAWSGERPSANVQEKARDARYRLLFEWCAENAVLHLLVAHHRDDQAETVLLRDERGSGDDGLAGIGALQEYGQVRLLRPLLPLAKARLQATADAFRVETVADPSNDDTRFDRVRIRKHLERSSTADEWYEVGLKASVRRRVRDDTMARHFAANCETYSEGYARLFGGFWGDTSDEIAKRALSAVVAAIGGRSHPPRRRKVTELFEKLKGGRLAGGTTSGGCKIVPDKDGVLVVREIGLVAQQAIAVGRVKWDGRFDIDTENSELDCRIGTLGTSGLRAILDDQPELRLDHLPRRVLETLPAVWALERVIEVPHLSYASKVQGGIGKIVRNICFAPVRPIQATRFTM